MRWILIVIGIFLFRTAMPFFGYPDRFTDFLLLGLCVYFGIAINKLQAEQRQLKQNQAALENKLIVLQNQNQPQKSPPPIVKPESAIPETAVPTNPVKLTKIDPWLIEEPISIWKDAPPKVPQPTPVVEKSFEPIEPNLENASPVYKTSANKQWESAPTEPSALENWLAGGNWIVRGGLGILFLGLVFLAKFAYDNSLIPLELRLAAIGAVGLTLLIVGWRSRVDKPSYGLSLQGGGVATLYLTIFATVKLTGQLPTAIALPLMLSTGLLAALLAIKQDALVLAVIGTVGGFLAPILLSDGHGSHIGLFTYYALLNVGVMTVALKKAWRPLNLLAFFFTFGVAGAWGMSGYQPDFMLSCLLFLALFFVMFVAITLLFTKHQTDDGEINRAIDASLLFGVPATSFGYAVYLLKPIDYGAASAAVLLSAVYCILAYVAKNRTNLNALKSPWAAMALLFATLAVPLACDARLTSSVWALEGAAVIWYAWQQHLLKGRLFGYLLIAAGTVGFLLHWPGLPQDSVPVFNASSIGLIILVLAYAVIGVASNQKAAIEQDEIEAGFMSRIAAVSLFIAGAGLIGTELGLRNTHNNAALAIPALLWVMAWGLQWFARRYEWSHLTAPIAVLPIATLALPMSTVFERNNYTGAEVAAFALVLLGLLVWQAISLIKLLPDLNKHPSISDTMSSILTLPGLSLILFWWLVLVSGRNTFSQALNPDAGLTLRGWFFPLAAAIPIILLWWLSQKSYRENDSSPSVWQFLHGGQELPSLSLTIQRRSMVMITFIYVIATTLLYDGYSTGLSYLPVLNLYELFAIGGLLTLVRVSRNASFDNESPGKLQLLGFLFANSILSRILSNFFHADFSFGFAWHSAIAATTYSIVWSLAALAAMWIASRIARRSLWIVGAGLLGVVAIKLILIDQAQVGTLARIVSFLGVGALMLVIGYVAPIPAAESEEAKLS
jgi:uncharacterized membrane protein